MPPRGRKIQDKWRMKEWYNVNAPPYFGGLNIGSIPSDDPNKLIGRVVENTLYDLTGDISQQHIKLLFKIVGVSGTEAETIFQGHEYGRDYLRSLVRRGSTRIDVIVDVTTKDGYKLKVSVVALSVSRLNTTQIMSIRKVSTEIISEKAKSLTFDQFVQEVVLGKVASDIYNTAKKIAPLRHIGLRKSKLITRPEQIPIAFSAQA